MAVLHGNDVARETANQQRGARVNDPGVLGGRFVIFSHAVKKAQPVPALPLSGFGLRYDVRRPTMSQSKPVDDSKAAEVTDVQRVGAALRASEERYRSIVDSAVDAILVVDRRGRIEAFNAAAERMFGYTAAEAIGRNVNTLMPEPYRTEHDKYMARYLATGEKRIIGIG